MKCSAVFKVKPYTKMVLQKWVSLSKCSLKYLLAPKVAAIFSFYKQFKVWESIHWFLRNSNSSKRPCVILFHLKIQVNGGSIHFIKPENVQKVLQKLNSFHRSLNFTFDPFPAEVHLLDIKIEKNKPDIFRKDTHTGQYVHFTSFEPCYRKKQHGSSASSNVQKGSVVTSNFLKSKSQRLLNLLSWNGYPSYVHNSILKKLKDRKKLRKTAY